MRKAGNEKYMEIEYFFRSFKARLLTKCIQNLQENYSFSVIKNKNYIFKKKAKKKKLKQHNDA